MDGCRHTPSTLQPHLVKPYLSCMNILKAQSQNVYSLQRGESMSDSTFLTALQPLWGISPAQRSSTCSQWKLTQWWRKEGRSKYTKHSWYNCMMLSSSCWGQSTEQLHRSPPLHSDAGPWFHARIDPQSFESLFLYIQCVIFNLAAFKTLPSPPVFSSLIMTYLGMTFFWFILLRFWAS